MNVRPAVDGHVARGPETGYYSYASQTGQWRMAEAAIWGGGGRQGYQSKGGCSRAAGGGRVGCSRACPLVTALPLAPVHQSLHSIRPSIAWEVTKQKKQQRLVAQQKSWCSCERSVES